MASGLEHPFSTKAELPVPLATAVFSLVTNDTRCIEEFREGAWSKGTQRAREFEAREVERFQSAHAEVKPCLAGKRTLLLEEMAAAAGFPSAKMLGHLLCQGCPAFGPFPSWQAFASKLTAPQKSIREVLMSSKWVKHAVEGKVWTSGDHEADLLVWEKTEEEVQAGKAKGPYSRAELDAILGDYWVPAPRVVLRQGDSIRPIDHFSLYGHNCVRG